MINKFNHLINIVTSHDYAKSPYFKSPAFSYAIVFTGDLLGVATDIRSVRPSIFEWFSVTFSPTDKSAKFFDGGATLRVYSIRVCKHIPAIFENGNGLGVKLFLMRYGFGDRAFKFAHHPILLLRVWGGWVHVGR